VNLTHTCPEVFVAGWRLKPALQTPMSEPAWLPGVALQPFELHPCTQLRVIIGHLPQWLSGDHYDRKIFSVHLCADAFLAEHLLWYITMSQGVKWKRGLLLYQKQPTNPFFCIVGLSQILYLPYRQ